MFYRLEDHLVEMLREVANPIEGWPFSEDRSTTLLCSPMVTLSKGARMELSHQLTRDGIKNPTHSQWVEWAMFAEMDVWVDERGSYFID